MSMRSPIVLAAIGLLGYELLAMNTKYCETWTDACLHRSKKSGIIIAYWVWMGLHLMTGGRL